MSPIRGFTRGAVALAGALLLLLSTGCTTNGERGEEAPVAPDGEERQAAAAGWSIDFSEPASVTAIGDYRTSDGQVFELETLSALLIEPSKSAVYRFQSAPQARRTSFNVPSNQLLVEDPNPALRPAPRGAPRFYERAEGAISAIGWVNQFFRDVRVTGIVNTAGGADGGKSVSRQGLLARWDLGTNYYWFHVDFAKNEYSIARASFFALQVPMEGSVGQIEGFDASKPYWLEFEAVGSTLRGRVYEVGADGQRGRLVGQTGDVTEKEVIPEGVSGILGEPTDAAPFTPLRASFARVSSEALGGGTPTAAAAATAARMEPVPEKVRSARALSARGRQKEAAAQLQEVLAADRDNFHAMRDLAWLKATSTDPSVRAPQESLTMANQSLDLLIDGVKASRRAGQIVVGDEAIPLLTELLRAGQSIAAAHIANGNFVSEPTPVVQKMITDLGEEALAARDLTVEAAMRAAGDSGELGAQQTASWVLAFARQINSLQPSEESAQLLRVSEQIHEAAFAQRQLQNVAIP